MILKAKPFPFSIIMLLGSLLTWIIKRRFNKMIISAVPIKPDHSYLLMCNHFSFWDGFWGGYLSIHGIHKKQHMKGFYIMVLEKQVKQNNWIRYLGCFSIAPGSTSVNESLNYAAEILNKPGNLLLVFPQGKLESNHVRHIQMKRGITEIIPKIKGNCQLLWSSNLIEYFESIKPSVYFHMLDCDTNKEFDFDTLHEKVNTHHKAAIQKQLRFTKEPG
jgi:hypothetical protein